MEQADFDTVIQAIADGESVSKACTSRKLGRGAFYYAVLKDPIRQLQYARALECRVEAFADETVEIADTDNDPQRARNRIGARQWYAGKIAPKRFGERLDLTVTDTTDPAALHAEGLKRARLMRDSGTGLLAQPVEDAQVILPAPTDAVSVAIPADVRGTCFD